MVFRKHNQTAGFSLIEILVAITLLGVVVVPIGSGLVLSFRLNARSDDVLQAQLAVSSAVETIMAEGYNKQTFKDVAIIADPYPDAEAPLYYKLQVFNGDITGLDSNDADDLKVINEVKADAYTVVHTYAAPYKGGGT